jgi:hypothetical protein
MFCRGGADGAAHQIGYLDGYGIAFDRDAVADPAVEPERFFDVGSDAVSGAERCAG